MANKFKTDGYFPICTVYKYSDSFLSDATDRSDGGGYATDTTSQDYVGVSDSIQYYPWAGCQPYDSGKNLYSIGDLIVT